MKITLSIIKADVGSIGGHTMPSKKMMDAVCEEVSISQKTGLIIDGLGPDGVSATVKRTAAKVSALQTGYLYHYAFAMLIGIVVIITWYLFRYVG